MPGTGINPSLHDWKPGDSLTAERFQGMTDQIRALSQMHGVDVGSVIVNGAGTFVLPKRQVFGVPFYNGEATSVPAYGICLLNGMQANGSYGIYKTKRPDTYGCQTNWLLNGAATVAASSTGIGQAVFGSGVNPNLVGFIAAYDSSDGTPAFGQRWGPQNATYLLKKNTGGFIIQGIYDSTNHYAIVIPEPMTIVRGKFSGDVASAGTGTLTVWSGAPGAEVTTSQTISGIYNDSSCTVKGTPQFASAEFIPLAGQTWMAVIGRTS